MPRPSSRPTSTIAWVAFALLIAVLGACPRNHLVVCTASCCAHQEAVAEPASHQETSAPSCCGGCCSEAAGGAAATPRGARHPGEERQRADCRPGCCVDVAFELEPAPLPKALSHAPPAVGHQAPIREPLAVPRSGPGQRAWPHDTGPPRTDRRTALLASTILRL